MTSVGVIGARGYVGGELLRLIKGHAKLECAFAASRKPVPGFEEKYLASDEKLPQADAIFLAMPDGESDRFVQEFPASLLVDLSADHRFVEDWHYGLPEIGKSPQLGARRISNPGCYATALQLAAWPILGILDGGLHCFGVSGYSGAGTTPSPRNDPERLKDGVEPYRLVGHTHEKEAARHLGVPVRFSPSVAPFFRGLVVTIQAASRAQTSTAELLDLYTSAYDDCPLVHLTGLEPPRLQETVGQPFAALGGFSVGEDGHQLAVACALDNLLKGAASQAMQNLNCALGFDPMEGLLP